MYAKAPHFLKSLQTLKPYKFFSTLPLTLRYFKNPKNPQSQFVVRQALPSEINNISKCISEVYFNRENVIRTLGIPIEQFDEQVRNDLVVAIENDYALVCVDQKTNEVAGAIYSQDLRTLLDQKTLLFQEPTDPKWLKFEDFYRFCFLYLDQFAMPKGINDVLYVKRIAVKKEYSQLTVGNNLMYSARFLHPKMTKANRNIIIATHEYTYNFCKMNGFELVKKISYKSIRDRDNQKPFENMMKLDNRTEADDYVYVMKRERENKDFFQEIKGKK